MRNIQNQTKQKRMNSDTYIVSMGGKTDEWPLDNGRNIPIDTPRAHCPQMKAMREGQAITKEGKQTPMETRQRWKPSREEPMSKDIYQTKTGHGNNY